MKPRKDEKRVRQESPKTKLRIVKLEPRIAPALSTNHNETLVRDAAKATPKTEPKPKLRIIKLEERIAPASITSASIGQASFGSDDDGGNDLL
jgi:hypothetical protein